MKCRSIRTLLTIMSAIFITACGGTNRGADSRMDIADAMMNTRPDSALRVLQRIDTAGLSESRIARYALLMTKAKHKNYVELNDTNLILKSIAFYNGNNDSNEVQSLYYYAATLNNLDNSKKACSYYHLANDLATDIDDSFYKGLSARALSEYYRNNYLYGKSLKYSIESQEAFRRYEAIQVDTTGKYSSWMDIMVAQAYIDAKQPEKGLEICSHPDSALYKTDSYFRYSTIQNRAMALHYLRRFDEAADQYRVMKEEGLELSAEDWCGFAHNLFNSGQLTEAACALDSARIRSLTPQDSLYYRIIYSNVIAAGGDYEAAYKVQKDLERCTQSLTDSLLEASRGAELSYTYKKQSETKKKIASRENAIKNIFIIIAGLMAISCIGVGLKYSIKLRDKETDLSRIKSDSARLKEKIESLNGLCNDLNRDLSAKELLLRHKEELLSKATPATSNCEETSNDGNNSGMIDEDKAFYSTIRSELIKIDEVCAMWYITANQDNMLKNLPEAAKKQMLNLRSDLSLRFYDQLIDIYSRGWIDTVRNSYPQLKESSIRLIRYLYMGFSTDTIAFLLKRSSRERINVSKSKLKTSLLKNQGSVNTVSILRKLGMR